jgi:glycosyltransferase involved in cell wall biosynthesis
MPRKLIFINSHPIQYKAPMYKAMAAAGIDCEVWYGDNSSVKGKLDKGFGVNVKWDIPLLEGYEHRFFKNQSLRPTVSGGFWGVVNHNMLFKLLTIKRGIIVLPGWQYYTYFMAILIARLRGHKVWLRTEMPYKQEVLKTGKGARLKRFFFKHFLFKLVKRFLYIGSQNRQFYNLLGVPEEKLIFSPYTVDNDRFTNEYEAHKNNRVAIKKQLSLPGEKKIILYCGKYIPKKRPLDLLQAFHLLRQHGYYLVMLGEGELRPPMEAYIKEQALHDVLLTGFINQSDIALYYSVADVFVMCSEQGETWGLSVNEAMNFHLPVVVADLTGCSDDLVKDKGTGYVSAVGDTASLAKGIETVLGDETERQRMAARSAEVIRDYSFDTIIKNIKTALQP